MDGQGWSRRSLLAAAATTTAAAVLPRAATAQGTPAALSATVDLRETRGPLPQIWAESAGSDRAAMTLREDWRGDLDRWRREIGLKRVRFHGIFSDELGVDVATILNRNHPTPNWRDVDAVYDGLLAHGVDPFVELSFMPRALASGEATFGFYRGNITPPASLDAWGGFIRDFVTHLAARYGTATVRRWPFEVWNEPNLPFFWAGTQQQYLDLYRVTVLAVKSVDPAIQVGGPSTAHGSWLPELAQFCATTNTPIDFFSTHTYPGDNQRQVFGSDLHLPQADVIPESARRRRAEIDATRFAGHPLYMSEWSSDSPAMIAHVVTACLGSCQALSHWVLSGVYAELGVSDFVLKEGDAGFGAMVDGIARPSFNTYKLLHALGPTRLASEGPVLAARGGDGGAAAMVWNLADVGQPGGIPGAASVRTVHGERKRVTLTFRGARPGQPVRVRVVDQEQGSPMPAWRAMGSPQYPTMAQVAELRRRSAIPPARLLRLDARGAVTLDLAPEAVALVELTGR